MLELQADEVHVWRIPLGVHSNDNDQLRTLLASNELDRADRFAYPILKERFVQRRTARRQILAHYAGIPGKALTFDTSSNGKPKIAGQIGHGVRFNATHSEDLALLAVSRFTVGIDLEWLKELPDLDNMIKSTLSASEQRSIIRTSRAETTNAFYLLWTCKEAVVKATGEGLSASLPSVSLNLPMLACSDELELPIQSFVERNDGTWFVRCFQPQSGYIAALATEHAEFKLTIIDFPQQLDQLR